jgi:hypothetical protein
MEARDAPPIADITIKLTNHLSFINLLEAIIDSSLTVKTVQLFDSVSCFVPFVLLSHCRGLYREAALPPIKKPPFPRRKRRLLKIGTNGLAA